MSAIQNNLPITTNELAAFDNTIKDSLINYLPNVTAPTNFTTITLKEALTNIESGKFAELLAPVRLAYKKYLISKDKTEYTRVKTKLPSYAFNGTFTDSILSINLLKSSNLFCGDIDGLDADEVAPTIAKLIQEVPDLVCVFRSPSNYGIKFILTLPDDTVSNDADFGKVFDAVNQHFKQRLGVTIDKACRDVRRVCFVSYDPDIYINYDAKPFIYESIVKKDQSPFLDDISQMPVTKTLNATTLALIGNTLPDSFPCNDANKDLLRRAVGELYQREKIASGGANNKDGYTLPYDEYFKLVCAFKSLTTMVDWADDEAFNLYDEVCQQMGGYDADTNTDKWTNHSPRIGRPATYKSLLDEIRAELKAPVIQTIPLDDETSITLETTKAGKYKASLNNLVVALKTPEFSSIQLGYDVFKDKLMYVVGSDTQWKPLTDAAYTELRVILHNKNFEEIPARLMIEAIKFVAGINTFDSAINWLNGLVWDGIPRVGGFCSNYFGVADSAYTVSVSQYMWTGMAARVFDAGCQLDMTPVFVGDQGDGKSTGIMALVPETDMATEISFLEDEDKTTRKMRGVLVAEISELNGIYTKAAESTKAFLTRRHDRIKPLYAEYTVDIARRCMFIGTTNNHDFLGDVTGERRWLPMVSGKVDREAIKRDRDQLWAEAAHLYRKNGIMWDAAQHLARDEHCNFKDEDLWLPKVEAWLRQIEAQNERHLNHPKSFDHLDLTTTGILMGALEIDPRNLQKRDEMRIGKVMAALGYVKKKLILNKTARKNYWFKG